MTIEELRLVLAQIPTTGAINKARRQAIMQQILLFSIHNYY